MRLSDFSDDLEVYEAFRGVHVTVNRDKNNYTLYLANRLYGRKEVAYAHDYSLNANRYFGSLLEPLDFAGNAEGCIVLQNKYCLTVTVN